MDTELRREIGAAIDTEMHRKLTEEIPATTALHPDVAVAHEEVAPVEATAAAAVAAGGVSRVNFDDTAASYASFTNTELLRFAFVRFVVGCCIVASACLRSSVVVVGVVKRNEKRPPVGSCLSPVLLARVYCTGAGSTRRQHRAKP